MLEEIEKTFRQLTDEQQAKVLSDAGERIFQKLQENITLARSIEANMQDMNDRLAVVERRLGAQYRKA